MKVYLRTPCVLAGAWLLLMTAAPLFLDTSGSLCLLVHAADAWKRSPSPASPFAFGLDGQQQQAGEGERGMFFEHAAGALDAETENPGSVVVPPTAAQGPLAGLGINSSTKKGVALGAAILLLLGAVAGSSKLLVKKEEPKPKKVPKPEAPKPVKPKPEPPKPEVVPARPKASFLENIRMMASRAHLLAKEVGTAQAARQYKEAKADLRAASAAVKDRPAEATEEEVYQAAEESLIQAGGSLIALQNTARAAVDRVLEETKPVTRDSRWPDAVWDTAAENDFVKAAMVALSTYEQSSRRCVISADRAAQWLKGVPNVESVEEHRALSWMALDMERTKALQKDTKDLAYLHQLLLAKMSDTLRMISSEERGENDIVANLQMDMLKAVCEDMAEIVKTDDETKAKLAPLIPILEESFEQLKEYHMQQQQATKELETCAHTTRIEKLSVEAALVERHFAGLLDSMWATISATGKLKVIQEAPFRRLNEALEKHRALAMQEAADRKKKLPEMIADLQQRMKHHAEAHQLMAPGIYRRSLRSLNELTDIDEEAAEVPEQKLYLPGFSQVRDLIKAEQETQKQISGAVLMRRVYSEYDLIRTELKVYMQLEGDLHSSNEEMMEAATYEFLPGSEEEARAKTLLDSYQRLVKKISKVKKQASLADAAGQLREVVSEFKECIYKDKRSTRRK
ncbi:hypothetical protein Emed_001855 [Eimeria media]